MNYKSGDKESNSNTETHIVSDTNSLFEVLMRLVPETRYLHPEHTATSTVFLNKKNTVEQEKLLEILDSWENVLEYSDDLDAISNHAIVQSTVARECYHANLTRLVSETLELEKSYYGIQHFFENAQCSVNNISFLNADTNQLTDLENTSFIDVVAKELNANYDRLDLSENYSLLVLPGYLKSAMVLEKWGKIAYNNKVMLITDYQHLDASEDVVDLFEDSNLTGNEPFRSNTIMTCNWLVGRGRYEELGEQDAVYVPPSAALAGVIYKGLLSQVSAGTTFGVLYGIKGVRFPLKKNDLSALEELGLIPMRYEHGKTIAYSSKTLFNGDNLGLQTYSVVRVFDYVTKVLMDFLNRRTFENFNANTRKELMTEVVLFLDKNTGPGRLIDSFTIKRFEQDPKDKNKIYLDLRMEPYFPSKNFLLKMNFETSSESKKWDTTYELD